MTKNTWTLPPDIRAHAAQAAGILLALANDTDPFTSAESVVRKLMEAGPGKDRALAALADMRASATPKATAAEIALTLTGFVLDHLRDSDDTTPPRGMNA